MRRLLFALVLALLVLGGCSKDTDTTTPEGAFIGGTQGLSISFSDGAPPLEVFDTNFDFNANIMLQNMGEWTVPKEKVYVSILGINPTDFGVNGTGLLDAHPQDDLEAAEKDPQGQIIQGTITNVEFQNLAYNGNVSGEVIFDFVAKVCYEYGTKAQAKICMNKDLIGKSGEERICDPNADRGVENSGAPVHISSMTESVLGSNKVAVTFTIKHVGGGSIYEKSTNCLAEYRNKDRIYVDIEDPGIGTFSCSGLESAGGHVTGYVTLYQGERSVRCTLDTTDSERGDFEKVLNLQLVYDYKELKDTSVTVKHGS
ncbi:MAG: hypothetical protein V1735_01720 [Nanoarchaeota archaeon]